MKNNKTFLLISILVIILVFSVSIIFSGCGRRARIREALEERESEEYTEEGNKEADEATEEQEESYSAEEIEEEDEEETVEELTDDEAGLEEEATDEEDRENIDEEEPVEELIDEEAGLEEEATDEEGEEGIDEEEPDDEPEPTTINVPIVGSESGYIEQDFKAYSDAGVVYVGDYSEEGEVGTIRGYVSFDITGLSGCEINEAILKFPWPAIFKDPFSIINQVCINHISWGTREIRLDDFDRDGTALGCFSGSSNGVKIVLSSDKLVQELQESVNNGKKRFQVCIWHKGQKTNGDDKDDCFCYYLRNNDNPVALSVTFTQD